MTIYQMEVKLLDHMPQGKYHSDNCKSGREDMHI